jgi:hypothetical protein
MEGGLQDCEGLIQIRLQTPVVFFISTQSLKRGLKQAKLNLGCTGQQWSVGMSTQGETGVIKGGEQSGNNNRQIRGTAPKL